MTDQNDIKDFLAHYGVLGMRWGRRLPDSIRREGISDHPDHTYTHTLAKNPTRRLSTQELKTVNDRLNTEAQYKRLQPTQINKGKKIVAGIIGAGATATAISKLFIGKNAVGRLAIGTAKSIVKNKVLVEIGESTLPKLLV